MLSLLCLFDYVNIVMINLLNKYHVYVCVIFIIEFLRSEANLQL